MHEDPFFTVTVEPFVSGSATFGSVEDLQRRMKLPERSFHALRHYLCSTLVRRGASIEAVRLLAGHGDLQTTQRYVHAVGGELTAAIAKLSGN